MNEFLQQFLVESRELAEQATTGLLALERSPRDAGLLDEVFRALHTLKGGAGIVDFLAMERAVHAAEDVLAAARAGRRVMDAMRVGECLACVDQVVQWLDDIEQTGDLPSGDTGAQADRVVARVRRADSQADADTGQGDAVGQVKAERGWCDALLARHASLRSQAMSAVRHAPAADGFFLGEDPLNRLIALPGLLALEAQQPVAWPALTTVDPYRCTLVFRALSGATVEALRSHLQHASGDFEVVALETATPVAAHADLPATARDVLMAQLALVRETAGAGVYGHVASAAITAARVLAFCGRDVEAGQLRHLSILPFTAQMRADVQSALEGVLSSTLAMAPVSSAAEAPRPEVVSRTLRVEASRIDALVRLTGELTIARNALAHLARTAGREGNAMAAALKTQQAVFEQLVGELQRSVLALRVLPLRVVFQRFPRLVREMSTGLGKPVELQLVGEDTEADKAIVEMLFEPLLHVIRNALDHGVESATARATRGKPPVARIALRASRQGDRVLLEVADDGNGLDVQRIRAVALERALVDASVLDAMTDAEIADLVFAPGFSTAAAVTALSGRGVGMDAVRVAVERMGGRVSIESHSGRGTTVRFLLPFSVMMTSVMSVEAGGQTFGVPLDAIVETIRVPRDRVSAIGAARAVVVRDQTVPVFVLADLLGEPARMRDAGEATLVITSFAGQRCGFDVDALGERLDVILKPLDGLLAGTPGIAGTSVLGDGRVLLVLDIAELLQ